MIIGGLKLDHGAMRGLAHYSKRSGRPRTTTTVSKGLVRKTEGFPDHKGGEKSLEGGDQSIGKGLHRWPPVEGQDKFRVGFPWGAHMDLSCTKATTS